MRSLIQFPIHKSFSLHRSSCFQGSYQSRNLRMSSSSSASGQLGDFLAKQKKKFLEHQHSPWTLVVGNEAGDLDSAASSIAYAYLTHRTASNDRERSIIPVIQSAREDLRLRPENVLAFSKAGIDSSHDELLCIDDIPESYLTNTNSTQYVLVDQNTLPSRFRKITKEADVVGIIDHHADEGKHRDANPRVIKVPTGSCASLVALHFRETLLTKGFPSTEIANLLVSAMCVDTGGFKPGGKATESDLEAAKILLPLLHSDGTPTAGLDNKEPYEDNGIMDLTESLFSKKNDVLHLSNRDLLRRDYKSYSFDTGSSTIEVGLSTVPVDLKKWVHKDPTSLFSWMEERHLSILGVLTSFRRDGKHKRQQMWVLSGEVDGRLEERLWNDLEGCEDLRVEGMKGWEEKMGGLSEKSEKGGIRVYKQGNSHATRKVVAPLVTKIVNDYLGASTK